MTPEQLASARASHWCEDAQPLLTLDDAKAWLDRMQLCLYLPRKTHVLAPAPSFVGAVLGASSATPPPEAIQQAHELLVRLVAEGFVVPLNLFGVPGEQPDFLIRTSALPQMAALQADRNWKKAPPRTGPGKVSPLAIEVWKLLDREGALTATEVRNHLGHELTEAATLRALSELWQNLRVAPLPQSNGEASHWEILSVTHKKEMAAGGTMAQSTALSLLVSFYLQSVMTATAEDIEAFLSPVASRTRIRDVIRGLSATRQLRTLSMDAQTFLFIEGSLPDASATAAVDPPAADKPAFMGRSAYRQRMLNKLNEADAPKEEDTSPRTYKDRRGGSASDKPNRSFSERPRSAPPASRPGRFAAGPPRPARPSFSDRRASFERPSFERPMTERPTTGRPLDRPSSPSSDRPFRPRAAAGQGNASARPFRSRPDGGRPSQDRPRTGRPFTPRPFTAREGTPAGNRPEGRPPFRSRTAAGGARPFRPRPEGDRSAARPPFRGKPGDATSRPFRPRTDAARPDTDRPYRKSGSEARPFTPRPSSGREGSARPTFRGKSADTGTSRYRGNAGPREPDARPFRPRPSEDRSPYPRRENSSRPTGRSAENQGSRPPSSRPASRYNARPGTTARPPRPGGNFTRRNVSRGPGQSAGSAGRPVGRSGAPGRNPGGTGRPGGPKFGPPRAGARPGARPAGSDSRPSRSRPPASRPARPPSGPRPGGMRPPTRKPRKPESDSE